MEHSMNSMTIPYISVLMSVYREQMEWLELSVNSILKQTFRDFEFIIVVDDPQNKHAINYIKQKAEEDDRIQYLINEENLGLTKSLNKGLRVARGKYIARMDADDNSYPNRFEKQYAFMESHPDVVLCGTSIHYVGGKGNRCQIYPSTNEEIKAEMLFNSGFSHPTIMIRRQTLIDHGISYDENYRQTQDYRLYETLHDLGEFANLTDVLLDYRISEKQISTRLHHRQGNLMQMIRRRMINKWLKRIGYKEIDFNNEINRIDLRKDILKLTGNKKDIYFNTFMKTMYYTNTSNKMALFIKSILNGDFFQMSHKDKKSYVGIVIGQVSPILL